MTYIAPENSNFDKVVLTNDAGCPVACEVFEGNAADPKTVASQIDKLRTRFDLQQIVLVGDSGHADPGAD